MKKVLFFILLCLLLSGCNSEAQPVESTTAITETQQTANLWVEYNSIAEAEAAYGYSFPLSEIVEGSYIAESYRVLNGELLEVVYRDEDFEVTARMQSGEGLDISGIYEGFGAISTYKSETHTITHKNINNGLLQLVSKDGYSYSFYAPNYYWGDSNAGFLSFLQP